MDHTRSRFFFLALLLAIVAISGCATSGPSRSQEIKPPKDVATLSGEGWWYARFFMRWPENEDPSWFMDLILAREVVAPALSRHRNEIRLWRFHRRAARDKSGHQFSFIFYSSPHTADGVYDALRSNKLLKQIRTAGWLLREHYDDTSHIDLPHIEDTSDPNWSPAIQRSWPYFIMGASEMWLKLIGEHATMVAPGRKPANLQEVRDVYREVNESIKQSWQKEGSHAYLHHLNAIFGYEPLIVIERRLMGF